MKWIETSASTWETEDGRGMVCGTSMHRDPYFTLHWRPGPHVRVWQEVRTAGGRSAYRKSLAAAQNAVEAKLNGLRPRITKEAA